MAVIEEPGLESVHSDASVELSHHSANGNGAEPDVQRLEPLDAQTAPSDGQHQPPGHTPARRCSVCGGSIPAGRRATCSATSAQRRDRRRMPRTTGAAAVEISSSSPPDLAAAVAALVGALGPEIDRLTVETGGRVLIVTRAGL